MWKRNFGYWLLGFVWLLYLGYWSLGHAAYVPGEMVVKFKPSVIKLPKGLSVASIRVATVTVASVRALNAKYGVFKLEQIYRKALEIRPDWKHLEDDYLLSFPKEKDVEQAVKDYKKDPNVVEATPNTIVRAFETTPSDPLFNQQWGLAKIEAAKGWDRTTGSANIVIAVLDTGINYNHEDFTGKVDTVNDWDFVTEDDDATDDYGHGTAVSGVIAAATNNGKGIAGVDWQAKVLPIKVLNNQGEGSITDINQGIAYLAAKKSTWEATGGTSGANVVVMNMSFGQYQPDSNLESRCQDAYNQGIVLVAAAGNGDVDWNTYPAYYPTVLAVAATDSTDKRSEWWNIDPETGRIQKSNYGTWVDVSAPGTSIYSTHMNGSYSNSNHGTSLAAPFAAGLAGLIKAANSGMTNVQIVSRIEGNTDSIDALNSGFEGKLGTGRINVYKALMGLTAQVTSPASGECIKGAREIRGTASGLNFSSYTLEAFDGGSSIPISNSATSVENGILGTWDTSGLNGAYTIRLRVFATDGSSAESSVSVIVDNTPPEVAITSPASGASIEGKVAIEGKAKDQNFDHYVLEYGEGSSPSTFQDIGTYYSSVDAGVLGTWETSGLKGNYTLRLTARDRAGTDATTSVVVNIAETTPVKEVQPQAGLPLTFALPNPFDRTSTSETTFAYNLEGNFNTTIYLFDLTGNLIWRRSYLAGDNGGKAGANNPPWNGRDLYGELVPNGVYLYQITADRRVIGRGKIIVLN